MADPSSDSLGQTRTAVMTLYPQIYFACQTRQILDQQTQRLLSRHQASILDHLDEVEPSTVAGIAGNMGVTAGTMSLSLDRLERKGYVTRVKDAKDKRRVHVRLTSAGVRMRGVTSLLDPDRVTRIVARLAESDRVKAVEGLAILARAAQETAVELTPEP
jgi:DNA-binding MarR family transcriptional regulator